MDTAKLSMIVTKCNSLKEFLAKLKSSNTIRLTLENSAIHYTLDMDITNEINPALRKIWY